MADRAKTRAQSAGVREADEKRKQTRRLVLQRHHVIVIPFGSPDADELLTLVQDNIGGDYVQLTQAWVERGVFIGDKPEKAIEAYAGKPGTTDAKLGEFRAPTESAMRGGAKYTAPPLPLIEREILK